MKKFFLRIHRERIVPAVKFCGERFGTRSVLVLLAVLIGILAALAIAAIHALMLLPTRIDQTLFAEAMAGQWLCILGFAVMPFVGLVLSFLVQHWWGGPRYAKSLSPLILSLNRHRNSIPLKETVTHVLSSSFAVGCGGSAGLEAPSVLTGSAIGANAASLFGIDRNKRNLLIGCGAAAAISAIFNSPIGGVLFAVEVLLPEFRVAALIPMLISSAVATVCSRVLNPESAHLALNITSPWRTNAVPYYFLCGAISALVGVYVIRCAYALGALLKRSFSSSVMKLVAGGTTLCLILAIFPILRGQGYWAISEIFEGDFGDMLARSPLVSHLPGGITGAVVLLGAAIFLKVVTSVLTVDSGGDGGIFAPSMFIGAFTGFAFARAVNLSGIIELQEQNFVIVGMCGVFTAVIRAPLTGVFLVAEVTGGYILLVPLMIVSAVSWCVARFFEPNSIYRKVLIENRLLYDDRDRALLQRIPVRLCISSGYPSLVPDMPIVTVSELAERMPQKIFPVLNASGVLQGVIRIDKILGAMLDRELASALVVFDLMEAPRGAIIINDDLSRAMDNFERCERPYLPVCTEDGKFAGFLFKDTCLAKYRALIRQTDGA